MNGNDVKTWLCFFEQSGTFKKQFRSLGKQSYDFDILNDYGETDFVIDLFALLDDFNGMDDYLKSFGDGIGIIAFFPCTMFENQAFMHIKCSCSQMRCKSNADKARYSRLRVKELSYFYDRLCTLIEYCETRGIPLVIENPWKGLSFLYRYFPFEPYYVDLNRRENGDYFVKPTAFWVFCFDPSNNVFFDEPIDYHPLRKVGTLAYGKERSEISPCYARRFIRYFLLGSSVPINDNVN